MGFGTMSAAGAFGFETFHDNLLVDGHVSVGLDTRIQWVRLGRPALALDAQGKEKVVEPDFVGFPMQFQPNMAVKLARWLQIYGTYNAGRRTFEDKRLCDPVYPGSSCFEAAVQVTPQSGLTIRGGMIQPSIGIRPDDHTNWSRGDAANPRQPLIAPNYAEWGAEVSYQPNAAFRTELGVVGTSQLDAGLNQGETTAELWPVAGLVRVSYLPQFSLGGAPPADEFDDFDDTPKSSPVKVNGLLGASLYGSDEFYLLSTFAGAGLRNGLETRVEFAHSGRAGTHETYNVSISSSWALKDWFVPHVRIDRAYTDSDETHTAWQYVAGIEFFPIPFVELRPEYRLVKTEEYVFGQPTIQLHLFY